MKTVNVAVPEREPQAPGNLYLVALPGKVLTELAAVAEAKGMTVAAFMVSVLDAAITEHKKRGR